MATTLSDLVDEVVRDLMSEMGATSPPCPRADARTALRDLLTVRPPAPMAPGLTSAIRKLLREELRHRDVVDAARLPRVQETHPAHPRALDDRVALWQGDLTVLRADAIVNAANAQMLGCFVPGHSCIDNAIHAWAGPELRAECAEHMRATGRLELTGTALLTGGYALPARHVIHTVGPIITTTPTADDARLLASSYRSILDVASAAGLSTVGLCSVSTGVFGYPQSAAAHVVVETLIQWYAEHPESTLLCVISLFTPDDARAYEHALRAAS